MSNITHQYISNNENYIEAMINGQVVFITITQKGIQIHSGAILATTQPAMNLINVTLEV